MKILLVCMQYDYGDESRGYSYEYNHFYLSLKRRYSSVELFDFMSLQGQHGRAKMNEMLLAKVRQDRPDVIVFSLYTDQFDPDAVEELQKYTKTLCFFMDDTWRHDYVREWAPRFSAFTTAYPQGEVMYRHLGLDRAIHVPLAVNEDLFRPLAVDKSLDVSFVGSWHPYRAWLLGLLRNAGVRVEAFGHGWPKGMLTTAQMIETFSRSKISLNLSNSVSWDARYLLSSPRALLNSIRSPKNVDQVKGRHFEIAACRCLQVSGYAEGLERVFAFGSEIIIFTSPEDLVTKVRYYLEHSDEREEIAGRGYQRTVADHTYLERFEYLFGRLGVGEAS